MDKYGTLMYLVEPLLPRDTGNRIDDKLNQYNWLIYWSVELYLDLILLSLLLALPTSWTALTPLLNLATKKEQKINSQLINHHVKRYLHPPSVNIYKFFSIVTWCSLQIFHMIWRFIAFLFTKCHYIISDSVDGSSWCYPV